MIYQITPDSIDSLPSNLQNIHLLDIENSASHIPETFIQNRKALFVISASKTQTYTIEYIRHLANLLNIDVAVDNFSGVNADKADNRFLLLTRNILSANKSVSKITLHSKDIKFQRKFLNACSSYNINGTGSGGDAKFNLTKENLSLLSLPNNKLAKRYIQRNKINNRRLKC